MAGITLAITGFTAPLSSGASYEGPCSLDEAKRVVERAWAKKGWRDGSPVTRSQRRDLAELRDCLSGEDRNSLQRFARSEKDEFALHRAYRKVARVKCGNRGYFAIPCHTVACESGYSWRAANPSSSAVGPYQLLNIHGRPWPIRSFRDKLAHHRIAASLSYPAAWDFGCA